MPIVQINRKKIGLQAREKDLSEDGSNESTSNQISLTVPSGNWPAVHPTFCSLTLPGLVYRCTRRTCKTVNTARKSCCRPDVHCKRNLSVL